MLILNFKPFPVLETDRLSLRRIVDADVEEIFFLRSDSEMIRYQDRDPATSTEQALQWIKMVNEGTDNNLDINWGLAKKDDDQLVGMISFWKITKEHFRAEIGYALHTAYQGKGLMHEAIKAVLHHGFFQLGIHSVQANVNPSNTASIRLLEKSGFVKEAYFKENYFYNGRFIDSIIYSKLCPQALPLG